LANLITLERVEESITAELFHNNNSNKKQYFNLLKLVFANIIVSHLTGTILIGVTHLSPGEWTWMDKYGITGATWYIKYIYAVYWGAGIVFTVGFGDISVANSN